MRSRTRRDDLPPEQVAFLDRLEDVVSRVGGVQNATALIWGTDQPRGTLSKILTGDRAPGLFTVKKIADGLNTSVSYLLGESLQELTPTDRAHLHQLLGVASQIDELRDWAEKIVSIRPTPERVTDPAVTAVTKAGLTNVNTSAPDERPTRPVPAGPDVRPTADLYGGTDDEPEQGQRRHGDEGQPKNNHGHDPGTRRE